MRYSFCLTLQEQLGGIAAEILVVIDAHSVLALHHFQVLQFAKILWEEGSVEKHRKHW